MHKDDLFLLPTGFALARIDEPDKPWEILKMDEKTVAVLSMPRSSSTYPPTHPPTSETGETKSGNLKEQERSLATALGIDGPAKSSFTFFVTMRRQPFGFVAGFLNKPQLKPLLRASHKFIWNAANLGGTDWDAIYEKNACLRGVVLGREPVSAPRPLIDDSCLQACLVHTAADMVTHRTQTVSNESVFEYSASGWSQIALGVITQFVARMEAGTKGSSGQKVSSTVSFDTSLWRNDRCLIQFTRQGLKVTQEFINAVDAISSETDEATQRELLGRLFEEYGHVFRMTTILGGAIISTNKTQRRAVTDQEEEETTGTIGVSAGPIGAKTSIGWQTFISDASKVNIEDSSTIVMGGSNSMPWSVERWVDTLNNYRTWSVIKVDQVIPVLDLVPHISEKRIPALVGIWTDKTQLAFSYGNLKVYVPVIPERDPAERSDPRYQYYWIGQSLDPKRALLVRELIPGALGEANCFHEAWRTKHTHTFFGKPKTMRLISPISGNISKFVPLVPCISNDPPKLSDNPWKYYRTVNRQLVVHVTGGETIFHPTKAQGCCIQPIVQATSPGESSVDLGLFVASHGTEPAIWGIKADKIHFSSK